MCREGGGEENNMKKLKASKVYFTNVESRNCSYYGSPKYNADMVLPDGTVINGTTATNSSSAYGLRNYESYEAQICKEFEGKTWYRTETRVPRYADVEYHITKSGSVIFDYVTDHKENGAA